MPELRLVKNKNTEPPKPKRDRRTATVGKLRLRPNKDAGILEWRAPRAEYPALHILDGGGFLYTSRDQRQEAMLTNVDGRDDQETADALWFAIMRSRVKVVTAFREEWLSEVHGG